MRKYLLIFALLLFTGLSAQSYSGKVFMRDNADIYFNSVYVTNLRTFQTVLSKTNGTFSIPALAGDKIRFTSMLAVRKDLTIGVKDIENESNYIQLTPSYHSIEEVVLGWKPSGDLRADVMTLKDESRRMAIADMLGLPQPKPRDRNYTEPLAGFSGGGLAVSVDGIYNLISGEQKKKERLLAYERMQRSVSSMRNYFGEDYFEKVKIPTRMIDNFLQFVYSSDNIALLIENGQIESTKVFIEKYLPIYQKRLRDSSSYSIEMENS